MFYFDYLAFYFGHLNFWHLDIGWFRFNGGFESCPYDWKTIQKVKMRRVSTLNIFATEWLFVTDLLNLIVIGLCAWFRFPSPQKFVNDHTNWLFGQWVNYLDHPKPTQCSFSKLKIMTVVSYSFTIACIEIERSVEGPHLNFWLDLIESRLGWFSVLARPWSSVSSHPRLSLLEGFGIWLFYVKLSLRSPIQDLDSS